MQQQVVPSWLRRGRTPGGQVMTPTERRLLRVLLSLADEEGWVSKTNEYLGDASKQHRTNVPRQLKRFEAWGVLSTAARRLANGKMRMGWILDVAQVQPRPQERVVNMAEFQRLQAELRFFRNRARLLEQRQAEQERLVRGVRPAGPAAPAPDIGGHVQRFAEGIGMERASFIVLLPTGERLFGDEAKLVALVERGLATEVQHAPIWATDLGLVPLHDSSTLRTALGRRMGADSDYRILETLRWYRAEVSDKPEQLSWCGPALFERASNWGEAERRAALAKVRHDERLTYWLRQSGPDSSVVLTREAHTAMSQEEQNLRLQRAAEEFERRTGAA